MQHQKSSNLMEFVFLCSSALDALASGHQKNQDRSECVIAAMLCDGSKWRQSIWAGETMRLSACVEGQAAYREGEKHYQTCFSFHKTLWKIEFLEEG